MTPQVPLPQTPAPPEPRHERGADRSYFILCGFVAAIAAALLLYSQTAAFCWDEGFHLLAARLIRLGKRPYLDFCFPQTPLNAYLNAAWMTVFGESWRSTHVLATILLSIGIFLAADFVFRRFPIAEWRLPAAIFSAALIACVYNIVAFGTVAQAYAICLVLTFAGFRFACAAIRRESLWLVFAAGLSASASAACSMLTAAAVPVILVWCVLRNQNRRFSTAAAFLTAAIIPFLPVIRLFAEAPRTVWFNVAQYQALYRRVNWGEATPHDFEVVLGFTESPPALMLILLGAAGVWFLARRPDRVLRAEIYLSIAITLAISAELATAHPTFERYFLLTVPFLAIPAAAGLYLAGSRLYRPDRPWTIVASATLLAALGLTTQLFEDRESLKWRVLEQVASKVEEVTPAAAPLYADESIYFLTRHPAPQGMEFSYGHKLELSPAQSASLHLLPESKLDQMVANKNFAVAESCDEDDMNRLKLSSLYSNHAEFDTCKVFWNAK